MVIEHSTSHQLLCYVESFELRNPLLRKAAKRWLLFVQSYLMAEVAEIIEFLKDKIGVDNVSENSDIGNDLGVDGDDYDELIIAFSKKYNVDISSWLWYFHCSEEGSWNSLGGVFFESPDKQVKYIPVTPLMLSEFTQVGRWNIQYPEHSLPKRRYDLMINKILVAVFLSLVLYKCAL